jgi:adenylate kinase family enzyme
MSERLFLVHGKPGSGKSTASQTAAKKLGDAYTFSMGNEIRARALHGKPSQHARELSQYTEQLRQSLPVPPDLVGKVVKECIETSPHETIIVDGYPQYPDRLPGFNSMIKELGAQILATYLIDVPDEIAKERLLGREQRLAEVAEDEAFITRRLAGFQRNVIPVIDALSQDYPVHIIDGSQDANGVANDLASSISVYLG